MLVHNSDRDTLRKYISTIDFDLLSDIFVYLFRNYIKDNENEVVLEKVAPFLLFLKNILSTKMNYNS